MHARTAVAAALLVAGAAAPSAHAQAPTIAMDRPCYVEQQPLGISATGFAAGADWQVKTTDSANQVFSFGKVNPDGTFTSTDEKAPILGVASSVPTTRQYTLQGIQNDQPVATTTFSVTNFSVGITPQTGKPTSTARWRFAGFEPGKPIYLHVRRGSKTLRNFRFGVAKAPCGTFSKRAKRLPIPSRSIRSGTYRFFLDSSKSYKASTRPQYRISTTVFRTFR